MAAPIAGASFGPVSGTISFSASPMSGSAWYLDPSAFVKLPITEAYARFKKVNLNRAERRSRDVGPLDMDGPDRLGIVVRLRPDDQGHVVAMSGASSAFIPTTL